MLPGLRLLISSVYKAAQHALPIDVQSVNRHRLDRILAIHSPSLKRKSNLMQRHDEYVSSTRQLQ